MVRYVPILFLFVFALATSGQYSPPKNQPPTTTGSTPATTTHVRFATFVAEKGFYCTLLLENLRQDVPITVTPALILSEGQIPLAPVTVPAHDTASIDITAFLNSHGYADKRGAVSVSYNFKSYGPLNAVVESYNDTTHVYLNSYGQSPEEYWAGTTFDAVVWAPDEGTKGFVAITNTSKSVQTVQVTALFKDKSEQLPPLVIPPSTTHFLPINDLVVQSRQDGVGIHVAFNGWPGDILVESQLFNAQTGFAKYIHFANIALQYPTATLRADFVLMGQQPVAEGFPQQVSFRSVAAVRNIGSIPLNVTPAIKYLDGGVVQTITLPVVGLAVGESRVIDLTAEQKSGAIPPDFHEGSLQLVPDSNQGNMVAELFNFDEQTGGYVVGPTVSLYPNRGTASIWRTDGTYQTAIMVENTADAADQVTLKLFSDSGTYTQTYTVPGGGLQTISVKDLQQNAVPDVNGNLLSGTYGVFSIAGSHGTKSELTFDKIIYSSEESDYVGEEINPCDYAYGGAVVLSGSQNPFSVLIELDYSLSGAVDEAAFGTVSGNSTLVQITHAPDGDLATITPVDNSSHNVEISSPPVGATICDACSYGAILPVAAQVTVPPKLTITGISPGQGLIGVTTSSVTISGTGLSGATVTAPSGITPTVTSSSSTSLVVNLAVASTAAAGNNSLTVNAPTTPSQQASVNFFVQVPTYFTPTGSGTALNAYCAANQAFYAYIDYQVSDQKMNSISVGGLTPQESVSQNGSPYSAFASFATPVSTTSTGTFEDIPLGSCFSAPPPPPNLCIPVAQKFQLLVPGVTNPFPITTTTSSTDCEAGIQIKVNPVPPGTTYTYGTIN